jgi:hypothetical protein
MGTKRIASALVVLGLAGLVAGCGGNRFDRTVTGAGVGALAGAGTGALLGPLGVATGALIGAGAGAGVGLATNESQIDLGRPIYR